MELWAAGSDAGQVFEARMPKPSYREVFTAACHVSLAE
ncbi:hypothetical protein JCM19236_550 [Vibrio sp. JCM 19236]|nr:hypothetical protein JCM19236_550 [Vibrio sp. JCM 19236]